MSIFLEARLTIMSSSKKKNIKLIHPDEARLQIGELLKLARSANNFSLRKVEWETEGLVRRGALQNYEKGHTSPHCDILPCLSSIYDVSIDRFFPANHHPSNDSIERFETLLNRKSFREVLRILQEMPEDRQNEVIAVILGLLRLKEE